MAGNEARRGRILYVSYDGLTDPLGEAQVIPYVLGLTDRGYDFHLLSFEKPDRFASGRDRIGSLLQNHGVTWVPKRFTARPRVLAKAYDAFRLRRAVHSLHRDVGFDLVHARSYPAAGAALSLKRRAGVPYLFDMRGFWVDERVEGGIWNTRLPHYAALYRYFKQREKRYLADAAGVVSLTEAAVEEMARWPGVPRLYTDVIPCSVDTDLFSASTDPEARARTREELSLPAAGLVVGYLGSINNWYLLDEMLRFFAEVLERRPDAHFLFVTRHPLERLRETASKHGIPPAHIVATEAPRSDVPRYLRAMDVSIYFVRPSHSSIARCPTKLGELMAVGVPFITNAGVGDVDRISEACGVGHVLADLTQASLAAAADGLDALLSSPREPLVHGARTYFALDGAVDRYAAMYEKILSVGAQR